MQNLIGLFLITVLGLALGSFATCISWRIPRALSFAKGRSFCPKCKNYIAWYDNIPVISYLVLGGKCRHCGKPISLRYPLIETFTAFLFAITYILFQSCEAVGGYSCSTPLPLTLFNIFIFITIVVIDFEKQIIPDEIVLTGILINFSYFLLADSFIYEKLLTAALASSFLLFLHLATKGRGMGLGDVKFAIFGGLLLNPERALVWMFMSFMLGACVGVLMIIFGKTRFGSKIAFGPYLAISLIIILLSPNTLFTLPLGQ